MDLVLADIIGNGASSNSARVVLPAVIDELVIPAVGGGGIHPAPVIPTPSSVIPAVVGGDPSWSSLILDSRSRLCGKAGIRLLTFPFLLFADLGGS